MTIKFNVEIQTSNEIDKMNFDEANEYLCRITDILDYLQVERDYIRKRIEVLRNDFELPFPLD